MTETNFIIELEKFKRDCEIELERYKAEIEKIEWLRAKIARLQQAIDVLNKPLQ